MTKELHAEAGAYTHACVADGPLVFVSGQVPLDVNGEPVEGDADEQAVRAVDNLVAALATVGAAPSDVVKLTTYVTDRAVAGAVARARSRHFTEPFPASTVVVVAELLAPEWLLEIEAVAQLASTEDAS